MNMHEIVSAAWRLTDAELKRLIRALADGYLALPAGEDLVKVYVAWRLGGHRPIVMLLPTSFERVEVTVGTNVSGTLLPLMEQVARIAPFVLIRHVFPGGGIFTSFIQAHEAEALARLLGNVQLLACADSEQPQRRKQCRSGRSAKT